MTPTTGTVLYITCTVRIIRYFNSDNETQSHSIMEITGLEIDITILQGKDLVAKDRNLLGRKTVSDVSWSNNACFPNTSYI